MWCGGVVVVCVLRGVTSTVRTVDSDLSWTPALVDIVSISTGSCLLVCFAFARLQKTVTRFPS